MGPISSGQDSWGTRSPGGAALDRRAALSSPPYPVPSATSVPAGRTPLLLVPQGLAPARSVDSAVDHAAFGGHGERRGRVSSVSGSVGHRDVYRCGRYRRPRSKALLRHAGVLLLPLSPCCTQTPELPPAENSEDECGNAHPHSNAPHDIGCRRAHSNGRRSSCTMSHFNGSMVKGSHDHRPTSSLSPYGRRGRRISPAPATPWQAPRSHPCQRLEASPLDPQRPSDRRHRKWARSPSSWLLQPLRWS